MSTILAYSSACDHKKLKYCLNESAVSLFLILMMIGSFCSSTINEVLPRMDISVGVLWKRKRLL